MNIWYFCMDAHVASTTREYAPSIHIRETMQALRAQGHQIGCLLAGDEPRAAAHALQQATKRLGPGSPALSWTRALLRDTYELLRNIPERRLVEAVFRNHEVDLAYERLAQNKSSVSRCCAKMQVPLIVESNAPVEERRKYWRAPLELFTRDIEKSNIDRADALVVVSSPLKQYYQTLGIPAEKIFVVPNGVNESIFSPRKAPQHLRSALNLDGKVAVGFVGNIHKYHGPELLAQLGSMFGASKCQVHFLILGGEGGLDWRNSMSSLGNLGQRFTFVEPVANDQVPEYIAAMDICILPQFMWYGCPMKILEYGAMGKAIVAPDLKNIRDILSDGHTALLFEPGNTRALFQAIERLASSRALRDRLGKAAREHILRNHTWARNAERIMEIYARILSEG